jgi:hypothetical protein
MNTDDLIPYERAAALIGVEPKRLFGMNTDTSGDAT